MRPDWYKIRAGDLYARGMSRRVPLRLSILLRALARRQPEHIGAPAPAARPRAQAGPKEMRDVSLRTVPVPGGTRRRHAADGRWLLHLPSLFLTGDRDCGLDVQDLEGRTRRRSCRSGGRITALQRQRKTG